MRQRRPLIAIVGRPNVGKSTLFNRLIRRRKAMVEDTPGITRDRLYADADFDGYPVTMIDTGGFVPEGKENEINGQVRMQAQVAVEECNVVLFVVDCQVGLTQSDMEVARYLRKQQRPIILVINKVDSPKLAETVMADFHKLGLGEPSGVSSEHNLGIDGLKEAIIALLPKLEIEEVEEGPEDKSKRPIRLAICGRPNVGKSTLINALVGEERVITSDVAGTTRDPIDTPITFNGRNLILTDTAGIRRKATISQKVEQFSVLGALRAIEDCDVVVLVLDANEAGVEQDLKIASIAEEKGRALLVVVNKWDTMHGKMKEEHFREGLKWEMSFISWVPMCFVSAKTGHRVSKVLDMALDLDEQMHFRAPTPLLNKVVQHITTEHPLPWEGGHALKIYYASQVGEAPPAFAFMCNRPKAVPDRYVRYVANYFRTTFKLKVPLRFFFRERPGGKERLAKAQTFKARENSKRKARQTRKPRKEE